MKLLLADDHPIYLEGLANLLTSYDYTILDCVSDGKQAVTRALELTPDVVLMDANMPGIDGIRATKIIKQKKPEIKIIILTGFDDDELLFQAVEAGASGFLMKNLDGNDLNRSLQDLKKGKPPFSPGKGKDILKEFSRLQNQEHQQIQPVVSKRHRAILQLLDEGLTYKEIGDRLCISEYTVKYHIRNIKDLYQLKNQAQMISFFRSLVENTQ
jgi:DNA-binding NarL/FixJ family response regulator